MSKYTFTAQSGITCTQVSVFLFHVERRSFLVLCLKCRVDVSLLILKLSQRMRTTKWAVFPAKTHIRLGIRLIWPASSLSVWRKLRSLATQWAHSEDSDQTGRMPRLIWVFAWCTFNFVGFIMRWLKCRGQSDRSILSPYNSAAFSS